MQTCPAQREHWEEFASILLSCAGGGVCNLLLPLKDVVYSCAASHLSVHVGDTVMDLSPLSASRPSCSQGEGSWLQPLLYPEC